MARAIDFIHWSAALAQSRRPDAVARPGVIDRPAPAPVAHSRSAASLTAAAMSVRDWDDLFDAVGARLTALAGVSPAQSVRQGMHECVEAMAQLHVSLGQERQRRQQLETDLSDARCALAQTRVELIGSRAEERHARRLALHDDLTSLPNRSFFGQWLDRSLGHAEPLQRAFAVFYIDLDGFKAINDAHGHAVGDELLRIVAVRLARAVRAEDVVGRLGGDEFACLLTQLPGRAPLRRLARKLFDAVSAPVKIGVHEMSVRPSIGIAMCPSDGDSAQVLLGNADAAMYAAKRQRCGYSFFDRGHADPRRGAHGARRAAPL